MGLHKRPDGCILFLDLFFKKPGTTRKEESHGLQSIPSTAWVRFCWHWTRTPRWLTRKAFGLASAGMPPCWHRPVPRRAGAPLFWPSWERTHSGSGPPLLSPPRAWIPHTRPFPAHCPPLCCLRPTARRSLTAGAPPGCSLPRSSWSRGSSSPGTPCSLPPPAYATARCGTPI